MMARIRRYFISGLLIWLPIWVTLLVLNFIINLLDSSIALIPNAYQPENLLGFNIPGFGVFFSIFILLITGMFVTNFLGRRILSLLERLIARIPLIRTIHAGVKQILQTVFSQKSQSFRKVYLVEYPRRDSWSIAFQTTESFLQAPQYVNQELVTLFVPTTPNPTSGFLIMVPKKDIKELDMSVDQALKMVISLGVVQPESHKQKAP